MSNTPEFVPGGTYPTRSACDHNAVFTYTVVARTARFVTVRDRDGHTKRVGVKRDATGEWALPEGAYSMAPVIRADRTVV